MAAEAARVLEYFDYDYFGTAAPARAPYVEPLFEPEVIPAPQEQTGYREKTKTVAVPSAPTVSLFAVFGTVLAGILLLFVVLAQISYNEIANETVRLNKQFLELQEQGRKLEIAFESVVDMKEVERYARDTLGMSRPGADQVAIIQSIPVDRAMIIDSEDEKGVLSGLGTFLSSLLDYFR